MKRIVKLAGFALLGFAIAALLYGLLTFGVLGAIRSRSGGSPESYMGEAFLIFLIARRFGTSSFLKPWFTSRLHSHAISLNLASW